MQWIINLMTINVTDIVNYESIRYEIDSNTSMYFALQVKLVPTYVCTYLRVKRYLHSF